MPRGAGDSTALGIRGGEHHMIPNATVTISKPPPSQTLKAGTKQPVAPTYTQVATGVKAYIEPMSTNPIAAALGRATAARFLLVLPAGTEIDTTYRVVDDQDRKFEVTGHPLKSLLGVEVEMEVRAS